MSQRRFVDAAAFHRRGFTIRNTAIRNAERVRNTSPRSPRRARNDELAASIRDCRSDRRYGVHDVCRRNGALAVGKRGSRVNYTMTTPCKECPFLDSMAKTKARPGGFTIRRLLEFSAGEFACHKACDVDDETGDFTARDNDTPHCAGALIFNEKLKQPHQMMRIAERLRLYDRTKLDMAAKVREVRR